MTPGRELDALVAAKVMGQQFEAEFHREISAEGDDTNLPHYSTDIAAAWEVRDKIASMLFSKRQRFSESIREIIGRDIGIPAIHHSEVILHVRPHHICLAALRACGIDL